MEYVATGFAAAPSSAAEHDIFGNLASQMRRITGIAPPPERVVDEAVFASVVQQGVASRSIVNAMRARPRARRPHA